MSCAECDRLNKRIEEAEEKHGAIFATHNDDVRAAYDALAKHQWKVHGVAW